MFRVAPDLTNLQQMPRAPSPPDASGVLDFVQVRAKVVTDSTGAVSEIPILLTTDGPLTSLVDYFLWRRHDRSVAWMRKVAQAVGLLLAYAKANHANFNNSRELFRNFVQRLYSGTIGRDGRDPSALYWLPMRGKQAATLLVCLSDFSDWLAEAYGTAPLNPARVPSGYDEMLALAASEHRRTRAFLGHTWHSPEAGSSALHVRSHTSPARRRARRRRSRHRVSRTALHRSVAQRICAPGLRPGSGSLSTPESAGLSHHTTHARRRPAHVGVLSPVGA
jgi:hypothetical protein